MNKEFKKSVKSGHPIITMCPSFDEPSKEQLFNLFSMMKLPTELNKLSWYEISKILSSYEMTEQYKVFKEPSPEQPGSILEKCPECNQNMWVSKLKREQREYCLKNKGNFKIMCYFCMPGEMLKM